MFIQALLRELRQLSNEQLRAAAGARPEVTDSAFLYFLSDSARAVKAQEEKEVRAHACTMHVCMHVGMVHARTPCMRGPCACEGPMHARTPCMHI